MRLQQQQQLDPEQQLDYIRERLTRCGLATSRGGCLSVRDDQGGAPALHRAVYAARPDVRAIIQAQSPALAALGRGRHLPDTHLLPQARRVCGQVGQVHSGQPGASAAILLAQGLDVVLDEESVVSTGPDLLTAFQRLETLDLCARIQLQAPAPTGDLLPRLEALAPTPPTFRPAPPDSHEQALREALCGLARRACEQRLMTSAEGTLSARVVEGQAAGGWLVTPGDHDRQEMEPSDLILVRQGRMAEGRSPSREMSLHQAVYAAQDKVGCVISAQPPHVMALTASGQALDSRAMSEGYVILRRVLLFDLDRQHATPEQLAAAISPASPMLLIKNDLLLATGDSVQQAYDRLEVADFAAFALLNARLLGPVLSLDQARLGELEQNWK